MSSIRRALAAASALGVLTVAACGSSGGDGAAPAEDLSPLAPSALDFPRSIFSGWDITDPQQRPDPAFAAIAQAGSAGSSDSENVVAEPATCGKGGDLSTPLWSAVDVGDRWAGQVGEDKESGQRFTVLVTAEAGDLSAVDRFVDQCATYTATTDAGVVQVEVKPVNAEPLRYGLAGIRVFKVRAQHGGDTGSVHETLFAVGQAGGRTVLGTFTTPGTIDGPTINTAGNWWHIVATKGSNAG